jgi:hypothetical protein
MAASDTGPDGADAEMDALADASARFAADLYFFVARRVIGAFGEAGEHALRQGLRDFGLARGAAIRAAAEAAGEEADLLAFARHYNLPMARAWRGERSEGPAGRESVVSYCPFAEQWRARGGAAEGQLYCDEVDPAIRAGYSPQLCFSCTRFLLRDGEPCTQADRMRDGAR